jgi:hypothetical protein
MGFNRINSERGNAMLRRFTDARRRWRIPFAIGEKDTASVEVAIMTRKAAKDAEFANDYWRQLKIGPCVIAVAMSISRGDFGP